MRRHALLIGCNRGKGQQPLKAAESDVDRMQAMLLRHSSWIEASIVTLCGDVSARAIDDAVGAMTRKLDAGDVVLVYYAGHAGIGSHADEYVLLLPSDAYPVAQLLDGFVVTQRPIVSMLVIDACFSERAAANAFMSFLHDLGRKHHTPLTSLPHTRVVIAASAADQPARERGHGGVLTTAFLQAAEHGGAHLDATIDGVVSIHKLTAYVEQALGPRQQAKALVYGSGFDVKTTLQWRLARGGPRDYISNRLLLLEERTRLWYASPDRQGELVSAFWNGDPLMIALGFKGLPVEVLQLQQADRKVIPLAILPTIPASRGIKVNASGDQAAVVSTEDGIVVYPASGSTRPIREYAVQPSQFVITSQNMLVTCSASTGEIEAWPLARNDCVARSATAVRAANHMRAFPDGSAIVTGSAVPGEALKWELSNVNPNARKVSTIDFARIGTEPVRLLDKPFGQAQRVAISPDGNLIAVGFGGMPGRIRVWSSEDLSKPISTISCPEHLRFITALEFSPDSTLLASGCAGGDVYITPLRGGAPAHLVQASRDSGGWVTALAFSPVDQDPMLAIGTTSGQVLVYVLALGKGRLLDDPRQRGEVYRLSIVTNESHPMQIVVGAKRGLECWDFAEDHSH